MILKCAVIDDEPLALELIASYVAETPVLELAGKYGSAIEAMGVLKENPVDLLFLDIQMPGIDGLEFSRYVGAGTRVIFTTAFDKYALDGYKVNALDYLLKPVSYNEFMRAVDKAVDWFCAMSGQMRGGVQDSIFVRSEYRLLQIELSRVLYIEGLKDYVKIYLEGEERPVLSLMSMKKLEEMLPADRFVRYEKQHPCMFRCPRHYCRVCGENALNQVLYVCVKCPNAFHASCLSKIPHQPLVRKFIICNEHQDEAKPQKRRGTAESAGKDGKKGAEKDGARGEGASKKMRVTRRKSAPISGDVGGGDVEL